MSTVRLLLLISILALTGGTPLMNLNTFDSVLAVESNCDARIQSVFGCTLGSNNEGSFAVASAKTVVVGEKESHNIGIDATESTFGSSITISENNKNNKDNTNSNIESQIPSTISAIPFP